MEVVSPPMMEVEQPPRVDNQVSPNARNNDNPSPENDYNDINQLNQLNQLNMSDGPTRFNNITDETGDNKEKSGTCVIGSVKSINSSNGLSPCFEAGGSLVKRRRLSKSSPRFKPYSLPSLSSSSGTGPLPDLLIVEPDRSFDLNKSVSHESPSQDHASVVGESSSSSNEMAER